MFLSSCKWQTWKKSMWTTSTNTRPIDLNIKYSTCADDRRIEVIADNLTLWGLHFFPAYFSSPHLTLDCAAMQAFAASLLAQESSSHANVDGNEPLSASFAKTPHGTSRSRLPAPLPGAVASIWLPPAPKAWRLIKFFSHACKTYAEIHSHFAFKNMASVLHRTLRSYAM